MRSVCAINFSEAISFGLNALTSSISPAALAWTSWPAVRASTGMSAMLARIPAFAGFFCFKRILWLMACFTTGTYIPSYNYIPPPLRPGALKFRPLQYRQNGRWGDAWNEERGSRAAGAAAGIEAANDWNVGTRRRRRGRPRPRRGHLPDHGPRGRGPHRPECGLLPRVGGGRRRGLRRGPAPPPAARARGRVDVTQYADWAYEIPQDVLRAMQKCKTLEHLKQATAISSAFHRTMKAS